MYFKTYQTLLADAIYIRKAVFMEEQGFTTEGDVFLEEHCPHIWMYKTMKGESRHE